MSVKGIDHWVIVAGNPDRTLDFYSRLGFTIAWEDRPGRPRMPTIRINDAQKINVHGPEAPARAGYLGARQPSVGGADFCLEWDGTVDENWAKQHHVIWYEREIAKGNVPELPASGQAPPGVGKVHPAE